MAVIHNEANVFSQGLTAAAIEVTGTTTLGAGTDDVPQLTLIPSVATGAPDAGAHALGEVYLDAIGGVYVCTVAGTPGTWVSGSIGGAATATSLAVSGDTTTATLETSGNADIGGTLGVDGAATFDAAVNALSLNLTSVADDAPQITVALAAGTGAPDAGDHVAGEIYVDSAASIFICTVSGTSGTWKQVTVS